MVDEYGDRAVRGPSRVSARAPRRRPAPSVTELPNGDHTAYVAAVYAAELAGGVLRPDGSEVSGLAWFAREELARLALSRFARAVLLATRHL